MELRQVRYFLAVVDAGTFSAAARDLSIVQSAVSQQVARLERELGTSLLDRSRRTPVLTAAGRRFVPAARALLAAELAALRAVDRAVPGPAAPLRIGAGFDLDRRTSMLADRWAVQAVVLDSATRQARVLDGDLDAALAHGERVRSGLLAVPVQVDELLVVVAAGHPLAGRDRVTLADLAPHRLVLGGGAPGSDLGDLVVRAWRAAGATADVERPAVDSAVLATVRATPHAWTVWYAVQASALQPAALGLRFLALDEPLGVPLVVVVRPERADLGAELASALRQRDGGT